MNLGAHIAVADRAVPLLSSPDADPVANDEHAARLLGSALPDLATIGGFRLLGSTDHAAVSAGIDLHHRTDDLFHRHRWFSSRNRDLTGALTEAGVDRGPAMACSHVGIELLLDGRLTAETDIRAAYDVAFRAISFLRAELLTLVPPARRSEWSAFLHRLADRTEPPDYADPHRVAIRLHRILTRRPRLALPEAQIEIVAIALAERQRSIAETALDLVADIAEQLP